MSRGEGCVLSRALAFYGLRKFRTSEVVVKGLASQLCDTDVTKGAMCVCAEGIDWWYTSESEVRFPVTNASTARDLNTNEEAVQGIVIDALLARTATMLSGMGLDDARCGAYAIVLAEKYAAITTETMYALYEADF